MIQGSGGAGNLKMGPEWLHWSRDTRKKLLKMLMINRISEGMSYKIGSFDEIFQCACQNFEKLCLCRGKIKRKVIFLS